MGAHLNSKRGDTTLFGLQQPPVLGSVAWRVDLATQINEYAQKRLKDNPDLNLVVAGDLNDFEFSKPLKALKGDILTNLVDNHDENDRFSYFYNGSAQTLDHMLVNNGIVDYVKFDMVHINALFMEEHGRASDHDPVIAKIYMPVTKEVEETEEIPFETERVENPELDEGVENILVEGKAGLKTSKVKLTTRNGVEVNREVLSVDEKAPVTQVVEYGTKKADTTNQTTDNNQGNNQKPGNNNQGNNQKPSSGKQTSSPRTSDISIFLPAFITLASAGAYVFADKRKK